MDMTFSTEMCISEALLHTVCYYENQRPTADFKNKKLEKIMRKLRLYHDTKRLSDNDAEEKLTIEALLFNHYTERLISEALSFMARHYDGEKRFAISAAHDKSLPPKVQNNYSNEVEHDERRKQEFLEAFNRWCNYLRLRHRLDSLPLDVQRKFFNDMNFYEWSKCKNSAASEFIQSDAKRLRDYLFSRPAHECQSHKCMLADGCKEPLSTLNAWMFGKCRIPALAKAKIEQIAGQKIFS
jgi:hypothetical protein